MHRAGVDGSGEILGDGSGLRRLGWFGFVGMLRHVICPCRMAVRVSECPAKGRKVNEITMYCYLLSW